MPDITDYLKLVARKDTEQAKHVHEQRAPIMPRIMDVTTKAQQVVDHPGWQFFLDKIAQRVTEVEAARATKMHRMVFGAAMGHDLELLKIELNTIDAEIRALKYAVNLVPEVLKVGQEIAGEHRQAAAGRVDTSMVGIAYGAASLKGAGD